MSPTLHIEKEQSDTPDTKLWSLTGSVEPSKGKEPGFLNDLLGTPTEFSRWFALTRIWSPWLAPRQGKDKFHPDKDAMLAAFERKDGSHLVVIAVSGMKDVLTIFRHDGEGRIVVHAQNDREEDGVVNLIAAVGKTFETAMAAVMYHARKIVTRYEAAEGQTEAEYQALLDGFKPQWLENWCKCFTCLWLWLPCKY
jgi:hypothetical protein